MTDRSVSRIKFQCAPERIASSPFRATLPDSFEWNSGGLSISALCINIVRLIRWTVRPDLSCNSRRKTHQRAPEESKGPDPSITRPTHLISGDFATVPHEARVPGPSATVPPWLVAPLAPRGTCLRTTHRQREGRVSLLTGFVGHAVLSKRFCLKQND